MFMQFFSSLTLREREKRAYQRYIVSYNRYDALSTEELDAHYINLKVQVEWTSYIMVYGFLAFLMSMLYGVWSEFFRLVRVYLESYYGIEAGVVNLSVMLATMLLLLLQVVIWLSFGLIVQSMKSKRRLLYILEEVRRKKLQVKQSNS